MAMLTRYGHPAGLFWILTQPAHTVTIMQPIVPFQRLYLTPLISSGSEFTVQLFKESMNVDFLDFFVLFCLHLLFLDILAPYTYWPFNLWKITFKILGQWAVVLHLCTYHLVDIWDSGYMPGFLFPFWVGANFNRSNCLSKLWKPHAHLIKWWNFRFYYAKVHAVAVFLSSQTEWRRSTPMSRPLCVVYTLPVLQCSWWTLQVTSPVVHRQMKDVNLYHRSLTAVTFMNVATHQGNNKL